MKNEFMEDVYQDMKARGLKRRFSGENLRYYRNELSLTQAQLGEKVGVVWAQIYKWESGSARPNADTIAKLADALELSMVDCLYSWR